MGRRCVSACRKRSRSDMESATTCGGGGTKTAFPGRLPKIQFCVRRNARVRVVPRPRARSRPWISPSSRLLMKVSRPSQEMVVSSVEALLGYRRSHSSVPYVEDPRGHGSRAARRHAIEATRFVGFGHGIPHRKPNRRHTSFNAHQPAIPRRQEGRLCPHPSDRRDRTSG